MSPTISSPVCQEQLVEAGKLVDRSVETCVKACRSASDDGELLKQVGAAAGVVSQALSDLLQHVRHYASCGEPIGRYDQATDTIMNVTENIFTSMGDAGECKKEALKATCECRGLSAIKKGIVWCHFSSSVFSQNINKSVIIINKAGDLWRIPAFTWLVLISSGSIRGPKDIIGICVHVRWSEEPCWNILKAHAICYGSSHKAEEFPAQANSQGVVGNMSSKTTTELSIWSQSASAKALKLKRKHMTWAVSWKDKLFTFYKSTRKEKENL